MEGDKKEGPDFRRKRQNFSNNIRRQHRNMVFTRNRGQQFSMQDEEHHEKNYIIDSRYQQYIRKFVDTRFHIETLKELKEAAYSDDPIKKHYGIIGVRKIMSVTDNPPIQQVIDAGLIPKLLEYVQQQQFPQLQLQATWALTNVASGTHQQCQSIVDKGAISLFIKLLKSEHIGIIQQAVWAVGNIATDSVASRDNIIKQGGVENTIEVIQNSKSDYIFNHAIWALSNLCRGHPLPKYKNIRNAILLLGSILIQNRLNDDQTINDVIWAICYNLNLDQQKIDDLFSIHFEKVIIRFLQSDETSTIIAAIRILARLTATKESQLDLVMQQPKLLDVISDLLHHKKTVIRSEACWVISNITTGRPEYIQELIARQDIMNSILNLFQSDVAQVLEQICYIFSNMAKNGESGLVFNFLKHKKIIKYYIGILKNEENKIIKIGLYELPEIFKLGLKFKDSNSENPFIVDFYEEKGELVLEELQIHDEKQIYEGAIAIVEQYFEKQDEFNF